MQIKMHYLVTCSALLFLGVMVAKPEMFQGKQNEQRSCKMAKGRIDCSYRYSEYKINSNNEIQYKFN